MEVIAQGLRVFLHLKCAVSAGGHLCDCQNLKRPWIMLSDGLSWPTVSVRREMSTITSWAIDCARIADRAMLHWSPRMQNGPFSPQTRVSPCLNWKSRSSTVETSIIHSPTPSKAIVRFAREMAPDLLIMGAHGHGGIKDLAFGNTINPVRHALDVPMLVVRAGKTK